MNSFGNFCEIFSHGEILKVILEAKPHDIVYANQIKLGTYQFDNSKSDQIDD